MGTPCSDMLATTPLPFSRARLGRCATARGAPIGPDPNNVAANVGASTAAFYPVSTSDSSRVINLAAPPSAVQHSAAARAASSIDLASVQPRDSPAAKAP